MGTQIAMYQQGDRLTIEWTRRGRLVAAAWLMARAFPIAMVAMAIFFAPDLYFGRIAAEEPVAGLFWLSLAGFSFFISLLMGLVRFMRRKRWTFDGKERTVVAEVHSMMGRSGIGEAELSQVARLLLVSRRAPRQSALVLELDSGEQETLFSGYTLGSELEEISTTIKTFLREQRYQVPVERVDRLGAENFDEEGE